MSPERARAEGASAILREAYLSSDAHGKFLVGYIYSDSLKRYQDGERFQTSYVYPKDGVDSSFDSRTGIQYTVESWAAVHND